MNQSEDTPKVDTEKRTFYAKSANANHPKISNREHLSAVAECARILGEEIGMPDEAELAGNFHDFGKYSNRFQGVLDGTMQNIDHAFAGAVALFVMKNLAMKRNTQLYKKYEPILEAIQGHHDGLISLDELSNALKETFQSDDADCCPSGKVPSLRGQAEFAAAAQAFQGDFPNFKFPKLINRDVSPLERVADMLDTRMLFSCLVDADYSVSASDDDPEYLRRNSQPPLDGEPMLQRLSDHCAHLQRSSTANPSLNLLRNMVFEECGRAGTLPMGLFTLTAPTGVGKTVAMLHFALQHCKTHALRRIIVVLPFLTLAEQTEQEYRKIFPDVLVDHSQSHLPEQMRELASRWDSPVIITTSVRFFESLFSDNPRDCRKLHNIAGSVVLFDEAQSLPAELAGPTIQAIGALCKKYRCTMVFSTATQPDFGAIKGTVWEPTEILPKNAELFEKMRRVHTQWRQKLTLSEVAEALSAETNACCIVNLRRHARILFQALKEKRETGDGLFLLTTDLCPAHRLAVVEEIKQRQADGISCLVVATQCIEAGVDLDFDVMYRSLAPLEAIIQAAGRCNRNGKLPGGGKVVIFEPWEEGRAYPGDSYERAAGIVKNLWSACASPELHDPQLVKTYYQKFFAEGVQNQKLEKALVEKSYPNVAKHYRLIKETGVRLIVPWAGKRPLFDQIQQAAQTNSITPALLREAAPITISCFEADSVKACATALTIQHGRHRVDTGYYLLNTGFEHCYDSVVGFIHSGMMHENYMV